MSEGFWSLRNAPAWWFDKRAWAVGAVVCVLLLGSRWYYGPQRVPAGQVVYGTEWCPYCKAVREHLTLSKIPFVDRNIEASFENSMRFMWAAGKGAGVPVVQVGPKVVAKGYYRAQIDAALKSAGYQPADGGADAEGASPRR